MAETALGLVDRDGLWLVSSDLSFTRQGLQVQTLTQRNVKEFADKRKARFENPRIGPFVFLAKDFFLGCVFARPRTTEA